MKLTNYKKGYIPNVECSIHGTITVTADEYYDIVALLQKVRRETKDTYIRDSLLGLRDSLITAHKYGYTCLGVTATGIIAKKYNLSKYRNTNNYLISISNNN